MAGRYSYDQPTDHGGPQRVLSNIRSPSFTIIVRGARLESTESRLLRELERQLGRTHSEDAVVSSALNLTAYDQVGRHAMEEAEPIAVLGIKHAPQFVDDRCL